MLRNHRVLAAAASALTLQLAASHASAAALSGQQPPLRTLHESFLSGPAGRRYTRASPLGGSLWELVFSATDLRTKSRAMQSQVVDLARPGSRSTPTLAVDSTTAVTRSPEHGLEFRQMACEDGKKLAVEVWTADGVRLARRVVEGVGAKTLPAGVFGTPRFSPSGSAVAWTAERQPAGAAAAGYWPAAGAADAKEPAGGAERGGDALLAGKFALGDRQSTGEALLVHSSQLVAWDWRADRLRVCKGEDLLPDGDLSEGGVAVPAHPCFDEAGGGLIFACHSLPPWRPGLSACLNRPTRLYHLPSLWEAAGGGAGGEEAGGGAGGEEAAAPAAKAAPARCLTPSLYFAHMPRLSPDGRTLAFAAREGEFRSHSAGFELRTMAWPPPEAGHGSATLVPIVRGFPAATDGSSFAGLFGFHDELASLAWLDEATLVFHSVAGATKSTFTVAATGGGEATGRGEATGGGPAPPVVPLRPPQCEGSVELLGASGGTAIVQCSSLRRPPSVWAVKDGGEWTCLVDVGSLVEKHDAGPHCEQARAALRELRSARLEKVRLPEEEGGSEALCLLPAGASRAPWTLKIHGGPHSASLDSWSVEVALLLASGVCVIQPNYRGSIGFGDDFCAALPGHVGEMDVGDCVALTRASLAQLDESLDPARGGAYGGSHGGFLTAWLLGCEERALYSCGVLWNPVVDLPAMLGTTDIPEWVSAEGLQGDAAGADATWPVGAEDLLELHRRSPLSVIDRVEAPALMLLGAADQRVPHKQGRSWVSALQQVHQRKGAPADVTALEFPGEGHAIASLEGNAHAQQSAVAWLVERLRGESNAS